jgi:protein tyrosine/serine phosphatase
MVPVSNQIAAIVVACSLPILAADVQLQGVRNFHRVSDLLYRGGQPSDEGFRNLAQLGVKTVIDLRRGDEHSTEHEQQTVEAAGMQYVNVPMLGIVAPSEGQIAEILELLDSKEPVFGHCLEGKDRTGVVIASYRIAHDGWTNTAALHEANSYGNALVRVGHEVLYPDLSS